MMMRAAMVPERYSSMYFQTGWLVSAVLQQIALAIPSRKQFQTSKELWLLCLLRVLKSWPTVAVLQDLSTNHVFPETKKARPDGVLTYLPIELAMVFRISRRRPLA